MSYFAIAFLGHVTEIHFSMMVFILMPQATAVKLVQLGGKGDFPQYG
ncbi:MAG: hypothetical protein Q4D37_07940 [Oscillospiraceae bacterium]|nr:hypothetical protein [Oscillospiraceae bacterium]